MRLYSSNSGLRRVATAGPIAARYGKKDGNGDAREGDTQAIGYGLLPPSLSPFG
jgi:hypothetical protein